MVESVETHQKNESKLSNSKTSAFFSAVCNIFTPKLSAFTQLLWVEGEINHLHGYLDSKKHKKKQWKPSFFLKETNKPVG